LDALTLVSVEKDSKALNTLPEDGIPESQVFQPKTINMGLLLSIWVVVV